MRKKIVAGNWKMNKTFDDAENLIVEIGTGLREMGIEGKEVVLCPPFLFTEMTVDLSQEHPFYVGVQDISEHEEGAYTGEISAQMVRSLETNFAIIGHSERRMHFNEDDEVVARKVDMAIKNSINPIFCCGEQLEARKDEKHFDVVRGQIEEGLFHLDKSELINVVIAYEPIWAIGTGETASPEQAQEMHAFIRNLISVKYNNELADSVTIVYGGSVKPDNAVEIFGKPDVDGGLIGGASLDAKGFLKIVAALPTDDNN
ncbi:MAG: triose-phosphate isomerase [Bacteroidota bacterium]|nr:triose-phosphate isomerase [Bacteroidota bacterium]